jgi:hypothetical protein
MFDDLSPNVIIILVVMVIGGLRWVIEQIKGKNRDQEESPTSEFEDLYEEARLEILERQGQINPDPEEVSRQLETTTVVRPAFISTPRTGSAPPPIPVGTVTPPPIRQQPKKRVLSAAEKEALANFEALARKSSTKRRGRSSVSAHVRQLLSSPTNAQDAIVLADILGPPKGSR